MTAFLVGVLVVAGASFALVAAIGVLRMPDLPMRMHAATKAGTLGIGLLLLALSIGSADTGVAIRSAAAVLFLFLTAPVAAHMIGRAAYLAGEMRLWPGTIDEWRDHREHRPAAEVPPPGVIPLHADRRSGAVRAS